MTVSIIQPNGVFHTKGQGFIMTQDGEVAAYTNQVIENLIKEVAYYHEVPDFGVHRLQVSLLFLMT